MVSSELELLIVVSSLELETSAALELLTMLALELEEIAALELLALELEETAALELLALELEETAVLELLGVEPLPRGWSSCENLIYDASNQPVPPPASTKNFASYILPIVKPKPSHFLKCSVSEIVPHLR